MCSCSLWYKNQSGSFWSQVREHINISWSKNCQMTRASVVNMLLFISDFSISAPQALLQWNSDSFIAKIGAFISRGRCNWGNLERVLNCADRPCLTNLIPDGSSPTTSGQPHSCVVTSGPDTLTLYAGHYFWGCSVDLFQGTTENLWILRLFTWLNKC